MLYSNFKLWFIIWRRLFLMEGFFFYILWFVGFYFSLQFFSSWMFFYLFFFYLFLFCLHRFSFVVEQKRLDHFWNHWKCKQKESWIFCWKGGKWPGRLHSNTKRAPAEERLLIRCGLCCGWGRESKKEIDWLWKEREGRGGCCWGKSIRRGLICCRWEGGIVVWGREYE